MLCVCLLLQDLLQSCSRGGEEDVCYPRPVWMSPLITH